MPSINTAMARSLREGFLDLLAASVQPGHNKREGTLTNIGTQITDAKTAFSSWDNCMNATFCKWPAIAIMIIGGLIIFSIVWCIIRCACCGLSCCCSCFSCLKCCGNCCGCCDPPGGRQAKYLDAPYVPPDHGYKSNDPMLAPTPTHSASPFPPVRPTAAPFAAPPPPQYAEFDVSRKGPGGDDELPEMPSWDSAASKKVVVEESVELRDLKKPEVNAQHGSPMNTNPGAISTSPNMMNAGATFDAQPMNHSPYGQHPQGMEYGQPQDPYGQNYGRDGRGNGYGQTDPYGSQSSVNINSGFNMVGGPTRSATYDGGMRQPQEQGFGPPSRQGSFDQYGQSNVPYGPGPGPRRSPRPMQPNGYPHDPMARTSPAPQTVYGFPDDRMRPYGPDRNYSSDSTRPLVRAPPQRQYSHDMPVAQPYSRSNTGFDYNTDYSRPNAELGVRQPNYSQPEPLSPTERTHEPYPGYKTYPPGSQQLGGYP